MSGVVCACSQAEQHLCDVVRQCSPHERFHPVLHAAVRAPPVAVGQSDVELAEAPEGDGQQGVVQKGDEQLTVEWGERSHGVVGAEEGGGERQSQLIPVVVAAADHRHGYVQQVRSDGHLLEVDEAQQPPLPLLLPPLQRADAVLQKEVSVQDAGRRQGGLGEEGEEEGHALAQEGDERMRLHGQGQQRLSHSNTPPGQPTQSGGGSARRCAVASGAAMCGVRSG